MTAEAEGRVYNVGGQDWDEIIAAAAEVGEERLIVNMGPQHPSTHGVLRVKLKLDGERVVDSECIIGYLHRGVEKIAEHRSYQQFAVEVADDALGIDRKSTRLNSSHT